MVILGVGGFITYCPAAIAEIVAALRPERPLIAEKEEIALVMAEADTPCFDVPWQPAQYWV